MYEKMRTSVELLVVFGVVLVLTFSHRATAVRGGPGHLATAAEAVTVFDVTNFGAKGDGKPIYAESGESINGYFIGRGWFAACHYKKGPAKLLIPNGTFVVAQIYFSGPCDNHVIVELHGSIVPDPDISQFPNELLLNFQMVDGVTLTGPGFIDASVRGPPQSKDSRRDIDFFNLMPLIRFYNATNAVVDGVNCRNPAAFHTLVVVSQNVTIKNVRFDADHLAPQSDTSGVYISASTQVTVSDSFIRTGDNCIVIAPGSSHVHVNNVTCSAGQGISIGADPYDDGVLDVKNVTVKNCTFKETTFGASIFPRREDKPSTVSDIIFEDLVMEKVNYPVVIHQQMPPRVPQIRPRPTLMIQVKVKDVHIRNINGTTTSRHGVTISCNPKLPCEGVEVSNINLKYLPKSLN